MNISTKASIAVSGKISVDEVKALIVAGVKAEAIKGDTAKLTFVSADVTIAPDGSASAELVYERSDDAAEPADDADPTVDAPIASPAAAVVVAPVFHPVG